MLDRWWPEADAPPIFYDAETNIDGDFDDIDPATADADLLREAIDGATGE